MSLYSRLLYEGEEEGEKIPIHSFVASLQERLTGAFSNADIRDMWNLSTADLNQAEALKDLLQAAPDKALFLRVLKDNLYMLESKVHPTISTAQQFNTRMQNEVTRQGGTLP